MARSINVVLTLDTKNFDKKTKQATRELGTLGRQGKVTTGSIIGLAARFAPLAAGIAAAAGAFKGLSSALNVSAEFEKTRVTLGNIVGTAEGGEKAFQQLRDVALELPIAFNELSSAAPALATVSKDINELEANTRLAADIAANFGIPFETAAGQLQRAFSAGAGAADVFREKGVLAAAGFEAGVKVSVEETRKRIAEFGDSIEGASAKLNTTFAGALNQTGDAFEIFQESIGEVIKPEFTAFLNGLVDAFRENKDAILEFGQAIGQNVIAGLKAFARGIATGIDIVLSLGATAKKIAQGIRRNFGDQIKVVADFVVKAFAGIVEAVSLVGVGIGKLISLTTGVDDVENFFNNINEAAERVRREGLGAIEEVGEGMATFIPVTTARDTVDAFIATVEDGADAIRESDQAVKDAADTLTGDYTIALGGAGNAVKKLTEEQKELVEKLEGQVRTSAIKEYTKLLNEGAIKSEEFTELVKSLATAMKVELALAQEALARGIPLSTIFDENSFASQEFVNALDQLQDALDGTVLTSENYSTIQELVKAMVDESNLSLEQQLFLLKLLENQFMEQEGLLSFLNTLGAAQKALSEDLATAFLEGESAGEAFQDFFKKMVKQILADILRLQIIQPILGSLFGLSFGAGGSVTGMDFGGSFFGGLFGGGKANGGPVMKNRPYIVGEQGPELFMPTAGGNVLPNSALGGGQVTYNINAVDARSFKELVASDPEYLYNVTQVGARRQPR
jgi:ABC-type transporter MlaC component